MTSLVNDKIEWPPRFDLFGVRISAVACDAACEAILCAARQRTSAVVSAFSVHALIEAANASELGRKVNRFAMIVPDGQPVRWALNWLYGTRLAQNVRGSSKSFVRRTGAGLPSDTSIAFERQSVEVCDTRLPDEWAQRNIQRHSFRLRLLARCER